jgi:hypothetical protein
MAMCPNQPSALPKEATHFNAFKLISLSAVGGWLVERYLGGNTLACFMVGAASNYFSWVSLQGPPRRPVIMGGILAAYLPHLERGPRPVISGCVAGSLAYSLYYAWRRRGTLMSEAEAKNLNPFF